MDIKKPKCFECHYNALADCNHPLSITHKFWDRTGNVECKYFLAKRITEKLATPRCHLCNFDVDAGCTHPSSKKTFGFWDRTGNQECKCFIKKSK